MRIAKRHFAHIRQVVDIVTAGHATDAWGRERLADLVKHHTTMLTQATAWQARTRADYQGKSCVGLKMSATLAVKKWQRLLTHSAELLADYEALGKVEFRKRWKGF